MWGEGQAGRFMQTFWRGALLSSFLLSLCAPLKAAEFTVLDLNAPTLSQEEGGDNARCHYRMTGTLENGDLDKFRAIAIDGGLLCLDSPGGSFAEAVRFIDFMQSGTRQGTRLEAGARCESACALIFMAGIYFAFEVGEYPFREMHHTARLGFHSPALVVPQGQYDESAVNTAYKIALQSVSGAIDKLVRKRDFDGASWFPTSLLSAMLATPPDSMIYVTTVGQAGQWQIPVRPKMAAQTLDDTRLKTLCLNVMAWSRDEAAAVDVNADENTLTINREKGSNDDLEKWTISQIGMWERGCRFEIKRGARLTSDISFVVPFTDINTEPQIAVETMHFHRADTQLADLDFSSAAPAPAKVVAPAQTAAPPSPGGAMTCTVVSGGRVTDKEPCTKIFREQSSTGAIVDYVWPSGGKTVVVMKMQGREINGAPGQWVSPPPGLGGDCTLNMRTGNTFCADPG